MTACSACFQSHQERQFFRETQATIRYHSSAFKDYRSSCKMVYTISFVALGVILLLGSLWLAFSSRTFGIDGVHEQLGFINPYWGVAAGAGLIGLGLLPTISIYVKHSQFKNKIHHQITAIVKKNAQFPQFIKGNLLQIESAAKFNPKAYQSILSPQQQLDPLSLSDPWILRSIRGVRVIDCFETKELFREYMEKLTER